jgi:hypothetical protein
LREFAEDRKRVREQDYASFIQEWDKTQKTGLWDKLETLINAPLNIAEAIKLLQKMDQAEAEDPSDSA